MIVWIAHAKVGNCQAPIPSPVTSLGCGAFLLDPFMPRIICSMQRNFQTFTAPQQGPSESVPAIMRSVLVAILPGIACQVWQFGPGILIQCGICLCAVVGSEAWAIRFRNRDIRHVLGDYSAAVTGVLLALSLPPLAPWWIACIGAAFSILIGKQCYGGLGHNPFNPAMVGYAMLLISFPREMTSWGQGEDHGSFFCEFAIAWKTIFGGPLPDALAMATPLEIIKTQLRLGHNMDQILPSSIFSGIDGEGWGWVNFGYLLGGLWLLLRGVIGWYIPVAYLSTLFFTCTALFLLEPSRFPSPLFHLFNGATMLGAFFIATDPVTAATTPQGRLYFGAGIGCLIFVIRAFGGYPDGVAFAVLLMNLATPSIDRYTR